MASKRIRFGQEQFTGAGDSVVVHAAGSRRTLCGVDLVGRAVKILSPSTPVTCVVCARYVGKKEGS